MLNHKFFSVCLLALAAALPGSPPLASGALDRSAPQIVPPGNFSRHHARQPRAAKRMDGSSTPVSRSRTIAGAGAGAFAALAASSSPAKTLPLFSGSFQREGVTYRYTMVGPDPGRGSATATVPVVVIPIRWVFPDSTAADFGGTTVFDASTDLVDGQTAIQGILRSPLFTPYPFQVGGTNVGTTQLADAYYRANFWSDFNTHAGNHLILSPTVAPVQTVVVPLEETFGFFDEGVGYYRPAYDADWLQPQLVALIAALGITPDQLPIFVTGPVQATDFISAHGEVDGSSQSQTYIQTVYESSSEYGGAYPDVSSLSHEVLEWINDPRGVNQVAGWPVGPDPASPFCLDRILEVADPLENDDATASIPLAAGGFTYHLADTVFIDWFTHASRSRSAGGLYSFFGNMAGPSPACVGDTIFASTTFDVPGAIQTALNGINDLGDLVGYYFDSGGTYHAFARRGGTVQNMDQPGALYVSLSAINDVGQIAGFYSDGNTVHGLTVTGQHVQTLDYPGAIYTAFLNINSLGEMVGEYLDSASVLHGFVYRAGVFKTIDVPGAAGTVVSGINDVGELTLGALDASGNVTGYVLKGGLLAQVTFPGNTVATSPGAVDDFGRVAGDFTSLDFGDNDAFVLRPSVGYQRLPRAQLNGMNNLGQMAGFRDGHGFIASMPVSGH